METRLKSLTRQTHRDLLKKNASAKERETSAGRYACWMHLETEKRLPKLPFVKDPYERRVVINDITDNAFRSRYPAKFDADAVKYF